MYHLPGSIPLQATATSVSSMPDQTRLARRALRLSWFTVAYNLLEGLASVAAGWLAGSVALVGFGLDSFVESLSGGVMIWRFGGSGEEAEERERRALRLVGYTFFVLGAYVAYEAVSSLLRGERPETSIFGIAITVASLIVMPLLYWWKVRTADELGSDSLRADARQTLACVKLSAGVLLGLLLNTAFGLWQADPLIALWVAVTLFIEGREAIQGEAD
jgi:divalent metal cation (Fe/Co/Zn/Cd) transporter